MAIREDYVAIGKASPAIVAFLQRLARFHQRLLRFYQRFTKFYQRFRSHSGDTSLAVFFRTRYNVIGN